MTAEATKTGATWQGAYRGFTRAAPGPTPPSAAMRARRSAGLVLFSALLVLAAGTLSLALTTEHRFVGVLVYRSGAVAKLWRSSWQGRRAGIEVRDLVVAVDGQPISGGPALAAMLLLRPLGTHADVTFERPDGTRRTVTLAVDALAPIDLGFVLWLPFSIGLLYLLLGAVLYFARPSPEATLAALLCAVASAFYVVMFDAHTTYRLDGIWQCYPILGPLSVHLFARFPERRRWLSTPLLVVLYAIGVVVIVARIATRGDALVQDRLALFGAIMLAAEFILDLALLGYTALRGEPAARNRSKSIFVGLALSCSAAVAWQFAARTGVAMTAEEAMILSALFPILIAYSILRRNLFDFDAVLRIGLISAVASATVLALYFALVAVGGQLLTQVVAPSSQAMAVAATLLCALGFHPVRQAAQRVVDRALYGGDLAKEVQRLAQELEGLDAIDELAALTLAHLQRLTGAADLTFLVARPGEAGYETAAATHSRPALEWHPPAGLDVRQLRSRALRTDALDESTRKSGLPDGLVVPLCRGGRLCGLILVAGEHRFATRRIFDELAPQIALALDALLASRERATRERLALLGEMAAVIVHEVKNPLGIMRVAATTLRSRVENGDSAELAQCITEEVDRIDTTVHRLLDLARPTEQKFDVVDLGRLVEQTVERLRPELTEAKVTIAVDCEPALAVRGDAEALRRALINLLSNARQAMPKGGDVAVRGRRLDAAVELAVEDNGPGIAADLRPRLFRPFASRTSGGTGLGLLIVKRTLEEHHGSVRFEPAQPQGARFVLSLPTAGS